MDCRGSGRPELAWSRSGTLPPSALDATDCRATAADCWADPTDCLASAKELRAPAAGAAQPPPMTAPCKHASLPSFIRDPNTSTQSRLTVGSATCIVGSGLRAVSRREVARARACCSSTPRKAPASLARQQQRHRVAAQPRRRLLRPSPLSCPPACSQQPAPHRFRRRDGVAASPSSPKAGWARRDGSTPAARTRSFAAGLAPLVSSAATHCACPPAAAQCSSVRPSCRSV